MKHKPDRINRVVRYGKRLHRDIADRKLGTGRKQSPVPTSLRETTASKRFGREPIAVNRQIEFVAENFETADVITVFVRDHNPVELLRRHTTLLQTQHDLPRAQAAINENFAVLGGDQRTVSGAPAAEHDQAEHGSQDSRVTSFCANVFESGVTISVGFHR